MRYRPLAIGAAAVAGIAIVAIVTIPFFLLPRFDSPLVASPADFGIDFETVRLSVDDSTISLAAWWMPAEAPRAIALLLHDGGSNRSFVWTEGLQLARALTQHGFHVLAPDLRGHGDSERGSEGPPVGGNLAPDISAWIDFALARAGRLPIVVHGFGLGGQVAIYAGAADPRIAAVVADSTWADLRTSMQVSIPRATALPRAALPILLWSAEHIHGVDFDQSRAVDVADVLGDRLLLIQNEGDPQIPLRQLRWLESVARGSEVWITPAPLPDHPIYALRGSWGTHTQSYILDPTAYTQRLMRFFEERITRAARRSGFVPRRNSHASLVRLRL